MVVPLQVSQLAVHSVHTPAALGHLFAMHSVHWPGVPSHCCYGRERVGEGCQMGVWVESLQAAVASM